MTVLDGVDLEIRDGESMVVLGRSGTGKSVLSKLHHRPHEAGRGLDRGGRAGGRAASGTTSWPSLRRSFGMLFQMAALFDSMTVGENVGLALREHTQEGQAEIARDRGGEADRSSGFPGSRGRSPRIFRAACASASGWRGPSPWSPKYILYDEPTTGLDPITAQQINVLIREMQPGSGSPPSW